MIPILINELFLIAQKVFIITSQNSKLTKKREKEK